MKRRMYLAAATALTLGGCLGTGDDDQVETDVPANDSDDELEADTDDSGDTDEHERDDEEESEGYDEEASEDHDDVETFDDFEDLERWDAVVGSLSADEDRSYTGSQSALLEASESEDQVRIVCELDDPEDFSTVVPGVALAAETTVDPVIQLLDEDGDRVEYRQQIHGGLPLTRCNFGLAGVHGDPDLREITQIQLVLWLGEETEGRLWVDDLHFVPRPEDGAVMIHFDGGYETVYTHAFPILEEYDYPATVFVPTGRVREGEDHEGDRLTEDHLADLDDAGWTVGSYATRGLDLTRLEGLEPDEEIQDAREWLADHGYEEGSRYFSYPSGSYDEHVYDLVEDTHDVAFAGSYPAQGYAVNPYLCSRVEDPDPDDVEMILEWTAAYGGITSLVYYALEEESRSNVEAAIEHLHDHVEAGDLEVILPQHFEEEFVL